MNPAIGRADRDPDRRRRHLRPGPSAAAADAEATGARAVRDVPRPLGTRRRVPAVERLAYFAEGAAGQLAGAQHLILAGATSPVSFAYPGKLQRPGARGFARCTCGRISACKPGLAQFMPGTRAPVAAWRVPEQPSGPLNAVSAGAVIAALLPESAIVVTNPTPPGSCSAATAGSRARCATPDRRRDRLRPAGRGRRRWPPSIDRKQPAGRRLGDAQ